MALEATHSIPTAAGEGVPAVSTDKPEFADDRPVLNARFEAISGIAVDPTGIVWVADGTHVRMYSPITSTASTVCLDKGTHQQPVEFQDAMEIAFLGSNILVVDNAANQIIQLEPHAD